MQLRRGLRKGVHAHKSSTPTCLLEQMCHLLKAALFHESRMQTLLDEVKQNEGVGADKFLVMQAVS